jgi:20S proteasome alpha/beta subunit
MTILIGVLCEDGIVIGSDSSATFSSGQVVKTIEQPTTKIFTVGDDLLYAGTGSFGLIQRLGQVITRKKIEFKNKTELDIGKIISRSVLEDMRETFLNPGQLGAIMAFSTGPTKFHLIEFDSQNFQPEAKFTDLWFCSMGSGQLITDPFLAFIRKTMFDGKKPKLNEGVFAVYWALAQAIDLNTGGINGPPQIATLSKGTNNRFTAKILTASDLSEHEGLVEGVDACIRGYREKLSGVSSNAPTPPATPSITAPPRRPDT